MRKGIVGLVFLSFLAFAAGCGGSSSAGGGGSDNTSPVAQIATPSTGSTYTVGDVIQFSGSASDSEDGSIAGASLVWTSDVDGTIGTGESCASSSLSSGAHQITLVATDTAGAAGTDTVTITINAAVPTVRLPDTGQTASYTDTFGEDSDYTINPPHYTKLDAFGNALADSAMNWTMVRDDVTDLVWEVKMDDGGIHDKDDTYTWQDAQDVFIAQLNSDNFGGYADWRLPTAHELPTLVDADAFDPSIDTVTFPNAIGSGYWSSTPFTYDTRYAWGVNFHYGDVDTLVKSNSYRVRAVRGGQPAAHLVDNGDGTVSDTATGLTWQQGEAGAMTWEAALVYCENLDLAGHDDWRLPNRNELQSIVDYEKADPSIDTVFFPGAVSSAYWSATSEAYDGGGAWGAHFYGGPVYIFSKSYSYYVRAIRGGQ
jgi:hypothetical protein